MVCWISHARPLIRRLRRCLPFFAVQRATLVNVKIKWAKDRSLDSAVARERHLRQAHRLLEQISSDPRGGVPAHDLPHRPINFGNRSLLPSSFLLLFPTLFRRSSVPSRGGPVPWFHLTDSVSHLRELELRLLHATEPDLVNRLRRLLMLTADRSLPLHTIDQLSWDMGLPPDYHKNLIPRYPQFFAAYKPDNDERTWLKLSSWDARLAVSELQISSGASVDDNCLAFPVSFTRGFGLRRKCINWLKEWQTLPYTSPYADPSGIDPRTDVSEKRIVRVFHELLHLCLGKKTERANVSNLRKPLRLPQKFTKVFERHPGIFYLSRKLCVQTVVLREAYGGGRELLRKHPIVTIRESYASLMREGMPQRRPSQVSSDDAELVSSEEECCTS
ncbi:hypothetical protein HPP92_024380 [Vanilla planifolia]|uniref:PORR domain-containing protein n=1 Tax=Vanilla planifolia TaxID=51239 RepID=A0A835PPN7_VANPL|nr:hypothetical protein HPP92_024380 [Vanilla planifolia]